MSKLPDAVPYPDKPPLHLKGGYLCVVAPRDLAEACFSVPAVRALKYGRPQGTLAILCEEEQAPLWQTMGEVNYVISYPSKASARQVLKLLQEVDVPFESSIVWESGELVKALDRAGITQRLGYPAKGVGKYLTDPVEVVLTPAPIEHRVRHYLNFVQKLGVEAYIRENFVTPPLQPAPEKLRIALAPGSEFGEPYQWPLDRFVEVVDIMEQRYQEIDWVVLGDGDSKHSQAACRGLASALGSKVKNDINVSSVASALEALPHCSALLACDGYTAHLAAHAGLPAVVMFGPNEPEWKRPLGKQSRVVREHVACSPCYLTKCAFDMRCQDEITVGRVVGELEKALATRYAR